MIIPANKGNWNVKWAKSGAIVPQKIGGKYWMYFLSTSADNKDQGGLAYSEDLMQWTEATKIPGSSSQARSVRFTRGRARTCSHPHTNRNCSRLQRRRRQARVPHRRGDL